MRLFGRPPSSGESSPDAWLVVGLGNPGENYRNTRHNIGQMVVESWAEDRSAKLARLKSFGQVAKVSTKPTVYVAETAGYMNVSGPPVASIARYYGIDSTRVVIVHDDLDIPFGQLRLKWSGGHGGHNGLKSIQQAVGSPDFYRVRMGIGRPPGRMDPAAYVLQGFSADQRSELDLFIDRAKEATMAIITDGIASAQARFHQKTADN